MSRVVWEDCVEGAGLRVEGEDHCGRWIVTIKPRSAFNSSVHGVYGVVG